MPPGPRSLAQPDDLIRDLRTRQETRLSRPVVAVLWMRTVSPPHGFEAIAFMSIPAAFGAHRTTSTPMDEMSCFQAAASASANTARVRVCSSTTTARPLPANTATGFTEEWDVFSRADLAQAAPIPGLWGTA
jgi:hypothetical protein